MARWARYMMFTQVPYEDHHIEGALAHPRENPRGGGFPLPNSTETLKEYLDWDDWKVLGEITSGNCGELCEFITDKFDAHTEEVRVMMNFEL